MGLPKPVAIRILINTSEMVHRPITEDLVREIHHDFQEEMIHFYLDDPSVTERDGVSETFEKLKEKKLKVAIDTGFDRQITNSILQRMGWLENNLIDASVSSDEVTRGRPYPDLIFKAMELTRVKDSRCVAKVGDTSADLMEGTSAGCGWVIGITTGAYKRSELQKEKHTHLIENVHEVLEIFRLDVD